MTPRQPNNLRMANDQQFKDLRSILKKYIYHWPLFLLFLIVASAAAYFYLKSVNPVYEVSATILVKDEKKSPQEKSALPELDQSSSPKNAETEIEIIRSKKLISKVVDTLNLWASYQIVDGIKKNDLYGTRPFKFILTKKGGLLNDQSVKVYIKDKNSFQIENLSGQKQNYSFNQDVKSNLGTWKLQPTEYVDQYAGSTITLSLNEPETVTNNYLKNLDAHLLDKQTPTIGLFVTDEVPQRGKDFLNNLITVYNQAALVEEKRTTKSTIDFIDNRLASLTGELNNAEKSVEGYRSSQGLTDISSQSKVYLENEQTNDLKMNEVNVQLNVLDGIERYANSNSNESAPATMGITDPNLNNLVSKLSELQLKKSALLATTPEGNPVFEPLNRQITLAKSSIKETIKGIRSSLLNSKRQLQAFSNKSESSIKSIPGQERQFVGMKRQQSIKENLYIYLLQKREELALNYASNFNDARIVDQANIGDIKWPRPSYVFAIALLLGFGIPFLIIYFRQSFTYKITERREIEKELGVPILGELSYEHAGKNMIVINNTRNLIGEQFRSLRTNLHYIHEQLKTQPAVVHADAYHYHTDEHRGRVTLLTSSVSKEGKSFISVNLAASLAASGKKTVVLEMDLRKPKLSPIFNLSADHLGITEFLSSETTSDHIIQTQTGVANLDFIGCGRIPDDPSELLEKEKLGELIDSLRKKYDEVVIDTPPLHLVTDSMIIARLTDISLYVIRQGYTGKDELTFIKEVEETGKLPNMNIIFNGIKNKKYGYGYSYDNSYYSKATKSGFSWRQFAGRF